MENLRNILTGQNPEQPFIMGRRFRPFVKQGYLSGGGGYVMSRAALLRFHEGILHEPKCEKDALDENEDVRIGQLCFD
ncbi:unnamed protein product [Dicrocoelium dendriticum]|nr:unnamed protein product [Dicrocoelium dendriticum]